MRQGHIPVKVARTELDWHDPLDLYEWVSDQHPEKKAYLFESLSGPEQDRRSAAVGWDRLAELRVFANRVTLEAEESLRRQIASVIEFSLGHEREDSWPIENRSQVWDLLRAVQQSFLLEGDLDIPGFAFGFLATFAYEAAWDMDELSPRQRDLTTPRCTLSLFRNTVWYDLTSGGTWHLSATSPFFPADIAEPVTPPPRSSMFPAAVKPRQVRFTVDKPAFCQWAERCLEHIRVGDIYQVQVGHRIEIDTSLSPLQVYQRLRQRNPSPYMYLLPWAGRYVIGASPELLFRIRDGHLVMRPIAGTASRAAERAEDASRIRALRESAKERAEHVMLVDLCRNDIGRVCVPGTLTVDAMMDVEPFSYVHHLVSTISAQLRPDTDVWSVLRATFPAGTMTGAPKLRAMQIIDEIEGASRGIYAGALGLIDIRGEATLALCIRTTVYENGIYHTQASAGVVADSSPEAEWKETLAKMGASYWALTGEELSR